MVILILGSEGFLGRNLSIPVKYWIEEELGATVVLSSSSDCDLQRLDDVIDYFNYHKPDTIINLAGRVGGFIANKTKPADIGLENLQIGINVALGARALKVHRIINFLGSCSYPAHVVNGIKESDLGVGNPDPTSAAYAIGKTAIHENLRAMNTQYGMRNVTLLPANVYGPYDKFDPVEVHVVPALLTKVHEAKRVGLRRLQMFGSGNAKRDFIFAGDLLGPLKSVLLDRFTDRTPDLLNIGTGVPTSIRELASIVCEVVGYNGILDWENSCDNDGQNVKFLDCKKLLSLDPGFTATNLRRGLDITYKSYLAGLSHDKI